MSSRKLALALLAASLAGRSPAGGAPGSPGTVELSRQGEVEKGSAALGGTLLSAWSPEIQSGSDAALWLLVRDARNVDGERSVLRLSFEPQPRLATVATGLGGWMETLAGADLGAGLELLASGEGRLEALGVRVTQDTPPAGEPPSPLASRPLLEHPGFDLGANSTGPLRRGVERRFVAAEPGRILVWTPDGAGALRSPETIRIPFSVARSSVGLRRTNPSLAAPLPTSVPNGADAATDDAVFVGPESLGHLRLRGEWIDLAHPSDARPELWAALPGAEKVEQSGPVRIGSTPILIVRTQGADEMNLFERQRLRVLPLVEDRTRAGAAPTLAVELDSKRWHETEIALGDVDGDGLDDLLAAFPEGLSGSDLVAQWWPGKGEGRFEPKARRSDVEGGGGAWFLVPSTDPSTPPSILFLRERFLELRPFTPDGRKALAEPAFTVEIQPKADESSKREVTTGAGGEKADVENEEPEAELLGPAEIDGRPGVEALLLLSGGRTGDRLLYVRRRAAAPR